MIQTPADTQPVLHYSPDNHPTQRFAEGSEMTAVAMVTQDWGLELVPTTAH
jgi:hypothetical protein